MNIRSVGLKWLNCNLAAHIVIVEDVLAWKRLRASFFRTLRREINPEESLWPKDCLPQIYNVPLRGQCPVCEPLVNYRHQAGTELSSAFCPLPGQEKFWHNSCLLIKFKRKKSNNVQDLIQLLAGGMNAVTASRN